MYILVQSSYKAISVPGFSRGAARKKQKNIFFGNIGKERRKPL
jgi:hypothetical protein